MCWTVVSSSHRLVSCHAVILQWLVWSKHFEWHIWASLVPIVGGILLTSVTELSFNIFGFCAAMIGCLATSTKTILAESLLHGYKFDRYTLVLPVAYLAIGVIRLAWCRKHLMFVDLSRESLYPPY